MGICDSGIDNLVFFHLQNKEDASELLAQKAKLEAEKQAGVDAAIEKEKLRDATLKHIANYVHESVPISDDEVCRAPGLSSFHITYLSSSSSPALGKQ